MEITQPQKTEIGRPLGFSREQIIDDVTELFWTHGYNNLSLNIIAKKTGLKRSSLYNTFKTKDTLLSECLKHYSSRSPMQCLECYEPGKSVGVLLHNMLAQICKIRSQDKLHRGCLAANIYSELVTAETKLAKSLQKNDMLRQKRMTKIIGHAIQQNELSADTDAEIIASIILSFMSGLNVHAKKGASKKELQNMSRVFLEKIGFCA